MKKMSFLRDSGEFFSGRETIDFIDAEMLGVYWETKPEVIEHLLPPPLKPSRRPIASAIIANYPKTNLGVSYIESALFITAEFDGEEGGYCLAMHTTNDMALVSGREIIGFPKKMGNIYLNRNKGEVEGWSERHGTRLLDAKVILNNKLNAEDALELFLEIMTTNPVIVTYNYKHFPGPIFEGFDYLPRLIRAEIVFKPTQMKLGQVEMIKLGSSNNDPWGEIEVVRVLGAVYLKGTNSVLPGEVVAKVDPEEFAPFSFLKWDIGF
jgi:acetoacetate decarboxylase